jgi:transposase
VDGELAAPAADRPRPTPQDGPLQRGGSGAQNADAGAPSGGTGPERRNSARRKLAAVTRLLRGEPLETLARELNVTVARLSEWRDRALVAAEVAMKERERDSRDEELLRLKAKLGEVTMANELLEQKIAALEGGRPLARRRSRR